MAAGLGQGYLDFVRDDQQRQMQQAALTAQQLQNQQAMNAQQARGPAFEALARLLAPGAGGGGIPPPPPGSPQGGPQAPPPGANLAPPPAPPMAPPMQPPAGSQMAPPPPMAPPQAPPAGGMMRVSSPAGMPAPPPGPPPPFRQMPVAAPGQPGPATSGEIGAPPAAPPQGGGMNQPAPMNLGKIVADLKQSGVPPAKAMDMLDQLMPIMNSQNKAELEGMKVVNKAQEAAIHAFRATMQAEQGRRLAETRDRAEDRRQQQGDDRLDIARRTAEAKISGKYGTSEVKQELTPDGMKVAEELIRAGKPLPGGWSKQGMSRGNAILNEMGRTQEGGAGSGSIVSGQEEFKAGAASLKQLTVRANAIEQSSKKIDKDIVTLKKYLESGTAGGVRLTNEPINKIREKFSSPELGQLMIAAQIVGTEYERMINGGLLSVAQLHEGAREDAKKLINADMTPTEMKARLDVMLQEIENQKSAFKDQISEVKSGLGKKKPAEAAKPTPGPGGAWKVEKVQ